MTPKSHSKRLVLNDATASDGNSFVSAIPLLLSLQPSYSGGDAVCCIYGTTSAVQQAICVSRFYLLIGTFRELLRHPSALFPLCCQCSLILLPYGYEHGCSSHLINV